MINLLDAVFKHHFEDTTAMAWSEDKNFVSLNISTYVSVGMGTGLTL